MIEDRIKGLERVRSGDLVAHPSNWRLHPKSQVRALKESLSTLGYADALVTRRLPDGRLQIVDGHARAELDPDMMVPVLVTDLTDEEAERLLLTKDPIAGMAETNRQALAQLLDRVQLGTGALKDRLEKAAGTGVRDSRNVDDLPEAPPKRVKPGDLWILGPHRLLCATARAEENWRRLMDGKVGHCVFTDPPYGISYSGGSVPTTIRGDDLRRRELHDLLEDAFRLAAENVVDEAGWYIWHADITRRTFEEALDAAGIQQIEVIIWAKPSAGLGANHYRRSHEPCLYAARSGRTPRFYGMRDQQTVLRITPSNEAAETVLGPGLIVGDGTYELELRPPRKRSTSRQVVLEPGQAIRVEMDVGTVWEVSRETKMQHPTQKPVELAVRGIRNSSAQGQIVLDPFVGAGTTLIGATLESRACYAMELDKKWCDVTIARWEKLTGERAVKLDDDPPPAVASAAGGGKHTGRGTGKPADL